MTCLLLTTGQVGLDSGNTALPFKRGRVSLLTLPSSFSLSTGSVFVRTGIRVFGLARGFGFLLLCLCAWLFASPGVFNGGTECRRGEEFAQKSHLPPRLFEEFLPYIYIFYLFIYFPIPLNIVASFSWGASVVVVVFLQFRYKLTSVSE